MDKYNFQNILKKLEKTKKIKSNFDNKKSNFVLISYYWGENVINKGSIYKLTYGEQVERLIKDCYKTKTNYYFVRYPELETGQISYQNALGLKPYFIKKCLETFSNYNCIFVDTDLRLLKYPILFDIDADCWFLNWSNIDFNCYNPYQIELSGGILGFANTHNSHTLLDILLQEYNPKYSEDKSFSGIITRNFLNIGCRCVWLPENYLYMFEKHEYIPKKGYTKIASYTKELKDSDFKKSDLVFVHEDFETGALDDIYDEKVGRNRYPPYLDKQFGEKLRCITESFRLYKNWNMNSLQFKHYSVDIKNKQSEKMIIVKSIPKIKSKKLQIDIHITKSSYILVHIFVDKQKLDNFLNFCKKQKASYKIVYNENNIPLVMYHIMKNNDIPHIYIHNIPNNLPKELLTKNIDFMTYNSNDDLNCYDPRILKTINRDLIYFNNNHVVLDFLKIWYSYNTLEFIKNNYQEKSLEYAFNISNAINIMRCYWLNSKNVKYKKFKMVPIKVKKLTSKLEQCGLKPNRKENLENRYQHNFGSRGVIQPKSLFLKRFL